jgi:hypothetical protein
LYLVSLLPTITSDGNMTKSKVHLELARLALQEHGWALPGAVLPGCDSGPVGVRVQRSLRGGGSQAMVQEDEAPMEEEEDAPNEEEEEEVAEPAKKKAQKPSNSRVLLEVAQLERVFHNFGCPVCGSEVVVKLRTVCIASSLGIECTNTETCKWFLHPEPANATTIHEVDEDNYERMTDFAVNVLYVLGFISMGDGPTEAARLLGLLGLPNDTTMESRSFGIIEERIAVGTTLKTHITRSLH